MWCPLSKYHVDLNIRWEFFFRNSSSDKWGLALWMCTKLKPFFEQGKYYVSVVAMQIRKIVRLLQWLYALFHAFDMLLTHFMPEYWSEEWLKIWCSRKRQEWFVVKWRVQQHLKYQSEWDAVVTLFLICRGLAIPHYNTMYDAGGNKSIIKGSRWTWKVFCGLKQQNLNATDEKFLESMLEEQTDFIPFTAESIRMMAVEVAAFVKTLC
jgi:hypothetical protein